MVKVITINTAGDIQKAVTTLNRIKKRFPAMIRLGMQRWGKILEKDMKVSAQRAGIRNFKGVLQGKGIEYRQGKRSNTGHLFMRLHGVYLDSMRPHFVSVTRRRTRLLAWAKQAVNSELRRKARMVEQRKLKSFSIFVKPHPFIARGFRRARSKLQAVLKRAANRGVQAI